MRVAAKLLAENSTKEFPEKPSTILKRAGYSEKSAQHSDVIVKGESFQKLLEQYLPDESLLARHATLVQSDNEPVSLKAVELGYKVKRKLADSDAGKQSISINFGSQPSSALIDGAVVDILPEAGEVLQINA